MGTEKRERQKANRAARQAEVDQAVSRKRTMRIGALVVGGIVAVVALVWIASLFASDDSDEQPPIDNPVVTEVETPASLDPVTTEG